MRALSARGAILSTPQVILIYRTSLCNEFVNAFPIFKVSRLIRVHTDSQRNGHNKMTFVVSYVW